MMPRPMDIVIAKVPRLIPTPMYNVLSFEDVVLLVTGVMDLVDSAVEVFEAVDECDIGCQELVNIEGDVSKVVVMEKLVAVPEAVISLEGITSRVTTLSLILNL